MAGVINADEIQLEKLEAIGRGPDAHGQIEVQCEVTVRYPGTVKEPLARLRIVVVDESGEWPLAACESPLLEQSEASQTGSLTLECNLKTAVPAVIDVNDLGVRPTVLFYQIPWTPIGDVALPPAGRRQCDTAVPCGDLQVNRWWVTARSSTGTFTEYEIGACVENRGGETLALGVMRMVLEDAEQRPLWSALCAAEGIGPGEERVLLSRIALAGAAPDRGTTRVTICAGGIEAPVVVPLAVWELEMVAAGKAADRGALPAQGPERLN